MHPIASGGKRVSTFCVEKILQSIFSGLILVGVVQVVQIFLKDRITKSMDQLDHAFNDFAPTKPIELQHSFAQVVHALPKLQRDGPSVEDLSIVVVLACVVLVLTFLYDVVLTFKLQNTLGKKLLKLKLVSEFGEHLTFGQLTVRWVGKWISTSCLGIGHLRVFFREDKRAWHDSLAKTFVLDLSQAEVPAINDSGRSGLSFRLLFGGTSIVQFVIFGLYLGDAVDLQKDRAAEDQFVRAIAHGLLSEVEATVKAHPEFLNRSFRTDELDRFPVDLAIAANQKDVVKKMFELGLDKEKTRALSVAVSFNNLEQVKQLLDLGLKPEQLIPDKSIRFERLRSILTEKRHPESGVTIEQFDSHSINPEIIRLLVERGYPLNLQDRDGKTLLMALIGDQNLEAAKILLEKGADLDLKDKYGKTARSVAEAIIQKNNVGTEMKTLLEAYPVHPAISTRDVASEPRN